MPPYNASDPSASFLSSSCLDFLLIEIVPLAYRMTKERDAGSSGKTTMDSSSPDSIDEAGPSSATVIGTGLQAIESAMSESGRRASSTGALTSGSAGYLRKFDEDDEELDAVHYRLEKLGYRVGQGLVERSGELCKG